MNARWNSWFALALVAFAASFGSATEPTAEETYMVELINRARANPGGEAALYGIALNEGVPASDTISTDAKQPLAINAMIVSAARGHAEDMAVNNYFSHYSPNGDGPTERIEAAGYTYWQRNGENIASNSSTGSNTVNQTTAAYHHQILFVDEGYPDRGHRTNMLNPDYREVGVGMAQAQAGGWNKVLSTIDFATPKGGTLFVCGVIYSDANGNAFYDVGEGLASVSLRVADTGQTVTGWGSGAYSIPLSAAGSYTIEATYNGQTAQKVVTVGSQNVKLDFTAADFGAGGGGGGDGDGDGGAAAPTPPVPNFAPTQPLDAAVILQDATGGSREFVTAGDVLSASVGIGSEASGTVDVYLFLSLPNDAGFYVINGYNQTASTITPVVRNLPLSPLTWQSILWVQWPATLPAGRYRFYVIGVTPGGNPGLSGDVVYSDNAAFVAY